MQQSKQAIVIKKCYFKYICMCYNFKYLTLFVLFYASEFRKTVVDMIRNHDTWDNDIYLYLQTYQNKCYDSPLEIHDDDGLLLSHLGVLHNTDLLLYIFFLGWWPLLANVKVFNHQFMRTI